MKSPYFAIPDRNPHSVNDAVVYDSNRGPWPTRSDGLLSVMFALDQDTLTHIMQPDPHELSLVPNLRLGVRIFHLSNLAPGRIGGQHFHRVKEEIIVLTEGSVEYLLEDVYGGQRVVLMDGLTRGLYIPSFIRHTYTVRDSAKLLGVSNTLYDPEDKSTYDTFGDETFQMLRRHYIK